MTQYKILKVKLSNSQLKLKSGIKNGTEVSLSYPSNVIGHSNNQTNFTNKLLLTDIQASRLRKVFGNNSSGNIKFPKTQLSKMV